MISQRQVALDVLYKTIKDESYSNLLMRQELNKLEPIQRAFTTNLINGVLRKYEFLIYQIENDIDANTDLRLKLILAMALYERFALKEKDYVVNNEYVNLCKNKYDKAFVNAILHKIKALKNTNIAYVKYCLPQWLYNLLNSQYDEESLLKILNIYQKIPKVYYRINKNKCNYEDLKDLNIEIIDDDLFTSNDNLIHSAEYKKGYFYIQDYNSANLYKHLDLQKDNTLLDVCCAPGSKLFNCLDVINPNNAYANDIHEHRVELIKKMADRLGYEGIHYLNLDGTLIKDNIDIKFDRILLDAPCSGLGVIGRKPDLKFHIKPSDLDSLEVLQLNLINSVSKLLNVDGILLYSTCTLNKKENVKLIRKFLSSNEDYLLLEEDTIINDMGDCFYYAKLRKVK